MRRSLIRKPGAAGMTLIEIIVAMGIFSIVMSMCMFLFTRTFNVERQGRNRVHRQAEARRLFALLEQDFRAMVPPTAAEPSFDIHPGQRSGGWFSKAVPVQDISYQTYGFQDRSRLGRPSVQATDRISKVRVGLLDAKTDFVVREISSGGSVSRQKFNHLSSVAIRALKKDAWGDVWRGNALPDAVEVTINAGGPHDGFPIETYRRVFLLRS